MTDLSSYNPHRVSSYKDGETIGKQLINLMNNSTYEQEVIKGFVDKVLVSHPTLQQSLMRAIYSLLMSWANCHEEGYMFDGRNEATVKFCKELKDKFGEDQYFPYI